MAIKQRPDSPTNNFCVLNAVLPVSVEDSYAGTNTVTHKEGNLVIDIGTTGISLAVGTFIVPKSGKWYFEGVLSAASSVPNHWFIGFYNPSGFGLSWSASSGRNNGLVWLQNDGVYNFGTSVSTGNSYAVGEVIGVVYDADNGEIYFAKNGTWINSGDPSTNSNPAISGIDTDSDWLPSIGLDNNTLTGTWRINFGQDSTFNGNKNTPATVNGVTGPFAPSGDAAGTAGLFYYPPPAGAKALCTANLSEMTPTVNDDTPQDYFKAVLYTGQNADSTFSDNGDNTWSKTGVGFQPDFVFLKERSAGSGGQIYDSCRGAQKVLYSSGTSSEQTYSTVLTSFDSGGFTLGEDGGCNELNQTYVAWCWKAGGAPTADNTATSGAMDANSVSLNGTLQSSYTPSGSPDIYPKRMSINTDAGFSIVKYTGNGTDGATIPHGLGKKPKLIIEKGYSGASTYYNWSVQGCGELWTPATSNLFLNTSQSLNPSGAHGAPDSNTFYPSKVAYANENNVENIAYIFTDIEGYSKFGSYTGNGSADGPFVYCGFRPAFVMIKAPGFDSSWFINDSARIPSNPSIRPLSPDLTKSETDTTGGYLPDAYYIDFLSNGFKIRNTYSPYNVSGGTYIYMAFAEQPFNYSNAR